MALQSLLKLREAALLEAQSALAAELRKHELVQGRLVQAREQLREHRAAIGAFLGEERDRSMGARTMADLRTNRDALVHVSECERVLRDTVAKCRREVQTCAAAVVDAQRNVVARRSEHRAVELLRERRLEEARNLEERRIEE